MIPLRIVLVTEPPAMKGARELKDGGDDDRLFDRDGTGPHGRAHGIGHIVGADAPGHVESEDDGHDGEYGAVFGNYFHDSP